MGGRKGAAACGRALAAEPGRAGARMRRPRGAGAGAGGLPLGGQGIELADQGLELTDGRAASPREQGVLGGVFGEGSDQDRDDRRERLAQGSGCDGLHS